MAASRLAADILICLDFEATCDDEGAVVLETQEIIEFPVVVLDVRTRSVLLEHRRYVKPVSSPVTSYCTELTGIKKATLLSEGCSLADAVADVTARLARIPAVVEAERLGRVVAVAHGPWDLGMQLPREALKKKVKLPAYFETYFDIKKLWAIHRALRPQDFRHDVGSPTLKNMCSALGRELQGQLHCGLDDARSVVQICLAWLEREDGLREQLFAEGNLLSPAKSLRAVEDAELTFAQEGSSRGRCVAVHITGLPYLAHGELISCWLAGILDGRRGLEANQGAHAGSGSSLAPTELWLRLRAPGSRPEGNAVALWEDPHVAFACCRLLCFGQEMQVECLNGDGEEQVDVRQVRASPVVFEELVALARDELSVPFPQTEEMLDAVRADGMKVCSDDWFCGRCGQHQPENALECNICRAPAARLPHLLHLRKTVSSTKVSAGNGVPDATPSAQTSRQPEVWERYMQPTTERIWFWNPSSEEAFFANASSDFGWECLKNSSGALWWWQESTGRFFYEPWL